MILVDTHVVLWLADDRSRISHNALSAIDRARDTGEPLTVCSITLLELCTLMTKGRIRVTTSPDAFLYEVEKLFSVLPITARACARALTLPPTFPKDPADRIIVATALVEGLSLVTADQEIHRSNLIRAIW